MFCVTPFKTSLAQLLITDLWRILWNYWPRSQGVFHNIVPPDHIFDGIPFAKRKLRILIMDQQQQDVQERRGEERETDYLISSNTRPQSQNRYDMTNNDVTVLDNKYKISQLYFWPILRISDVHTITVHTD